jgi:hypothetical protein
MWSIVATMSLLTFAPTAAVFASTAPGDEPTKAARSVHLAYSAPENVDVFYNELIVTRSVPGSYFMCCGFAGGYFGIQELDQGNKVLLFSVWDPGTQAPDATKPPEDQVRIVSQSSRARVRRFGGEGTGLQCFVDYNWEVNKTYCFAVKAAVQDGKTSYAAYFRPATADEWLHLATFRRTGDQRLSGLYSFIEDFRRDVRSAHETRRARFGNGWVSTPGSGFSRLTGARFTASTASWEAKETIDAGVEGTMFYLQTGGDTRPRIPLRSTIRVETDESLKPPEVPAK